LTYLAEHPELKFLMIDEIEKIGKNELSILLTLMETGKLIITKKTIMCLRIFATCNNKNKLSQ
jgi:midasin (ATPase involved in ribosome maturation)